MDARPRELRKSSEILAEIMAKYPTRLETPGAPPSPPTQEEMTIVPPSYARQLLVDQPRTTSTEKAVVNNIRKASQRVQFAGLCALGGALWHRAVHNHASKEILRKAAEEHRMEMNNFASMEATMCLKLHAAEAERSALEEKVRRMEDKVGQLKAAAAADRDAAAGAYVAQAAELADARYQNEQLSSVAAQQLLEMRTAHENALQEKEAAAAAAAEAAQEKEARMQAKLSEQSQQIVVLEEALTLHRQEFTEVCEELEAAQQGKLMEKEKMKTTWARRLANRTKDLDEKVQAADARAAQAERKLADLKSLLVLKEREHAKRVKDLSAQVAAAARVGAVRSPNAPITTHSRTGSAVSSRSSSRATSPVRSSEKLSQARASAQRAKEQLDGAMQALAAKARECEELKLALEESVRLRRKTEIDMRERHQRVVKEMQRKVEGGKQPVAATGADLDTRLSVLGAIPETVNHLEEQAAEAEAERDAAVARATRAEAATEAAREQVAALTLELKRSQAAQAAQAAVGAAGVGESPRGELRVVRAERDELAAEVAMLKQMVKTTSLAVNFKRSQHTSAETSLRSSQHTSRAASPTPSS